MKKLNIVIFLLLSSSFYVVAQQKAKEKLMVITISEFNGSIVGQALPNMIISRTDSVQDVRYINFGLIAKAKNQLAAHESLILEVLKPYLNNGWRLVSTSLEAPVSQGNVYNENYRYFFTKDE